MDTSGAGEISSNYRYASRSMMADSTPSISPQSHSSQLPSQRTRKRLRTVSVHHTRLASSPRTPSAETALRFFIDENGRVTESGDFMSPHASLSRSISSKTAPSAGLPISTLRDTIAGDDTRPPNTTNNQATTPGQPTKPGVVPLHTAVPFSPRAREGFPTHSVKNSAKPALFSPAPITSSTQHAMFSRFGLSRAAPKQTEKTRRLNKTSSKAATAPQDEIQLLKPETRCPLDGYSYTFDRTGNAAAASDERMIVYANQRGLDLLREVRRPLNYIDQVTAQRTPPKKPAQFIHRHDSGAQGLVMPSPTLDLPRKTNRRQSA